MNLSNRNQWAAWLIVAGTPFAGVIAVRALSGVGGPQTAQGATDGEEEIVEDEGAIGDEAAVVAHRAWVVGPKDSVHLDGAVSEHLGSWNTPLFQPTDEAPAFVDSEEDEESTRPAGAPATPSASRFDDLFRVTSLMATRDGAVAVIDRKLRRVGDGLDEGVTVESIDLAARVVTLRSPDGGTFERRPNR